LHIEHPPSLARTGASFGGTGPPSSERADLIHPVPPQDPQLMSTSALGSV
jgi:hypothetical protein